MAGGIGSTVRLTTASIRTGPLWASAAATPFSTSAGSSSRIPRTPQASAMAAKFGFLNSVPKSRKPVDFCSISIKPSALLLNTTTFTGRPSCARLRKSPITRHRDHLSARKRRLRANRVRHRIGHRAMPERSDQPPLAVHRQIARGPHRRQTDVAGEDGVLRSLIAERFGDLLRVDRFATGLVDREPVEILARLAVMFRRPVEMGAVARLRDERQHTFKRRANVADHAEIDRRTA